MNKCQRWVFGVPFAYSSRPPDADAADSVTLGSTFSISNDGSTVKEFTIPPEYEVRYDARTLSTTRPFLLSVKLNATLARPLLTS
eukprot:CAMPEP_0178605156 /NCGR_PEP_ID=MMETSP0697-20121206/36420_1 /TAXON_ID=265572 /ORGANISM="Extubocellulus spinifer, Strain CCMP396" /LENGTH=84 /DNA_ID=CAMNT_0020243561 /DNA_START=163 /DNA_END=418 /DNA_ORIENTATION=+